MNSADGRGNVLSCKANKKGRRAIGRRLRHECSISLDYFQDRCKSEVCRSYEMEIASCIWRIVSVMATSKQTE